MKYLWLLAALVVAPAATPTRPTNCAATARPPRKCTPSKSSDPFKSIRSARCIAYVAGFADGYAVSNYLAEQVSVKLNAFCLPNDPDLSMRLVRAVTIHVERVPPNTTMSTATLVAGALAKAFPCTEALESKK
jgi:hypothetical protein